METLHSIGTFGDVCTPSKLRVLPPLALLPPLLVLGLKKPLEDFFREALQGTPKRKAPKPPKSPNPKPLNP